MLFVAACDWSRTSKPLVASGKCATADRMRTFCMTRMTSHAPVCLVGAHIKVRGMHVTKLLSGVVPLNYRQMEWTSNTCIKGLQRPSETIDNWNREYTMYSSCQSDTWGLCCYLFWLGYFPWQHHSTKTCTKILSWHEVWDFQQCKTMVHYLAALKRYTKNGHR